MSVKVLPRASSELAADFSILGAGKSIAAGIISQEGAGSISANISAPDSVKKAIEPVFDKFLGEVLKKTNDQEQPIVREFWEILGPTIKGGVLDIAADFRPSGNDRFSVVVAAHVKDATKLDAFARKLLPHAPPGERAKVKLDVSKAAGVAVHEFELPLDATARDILGDSAKGAAAFRKESVLFAIGGDAVAAVKSAIESSGKSAPIAEGVVSMRKFAPLIERKEPGVGAVASAKKAYPEGINDAIRVTVSGGESLEIRLSTSTRIIQFGMLQEQARRGR